MNTGPDLNGKVAVVTGGGGVLGSSFAEALASRGASVAVLDLNKDAAEKAAERIRRKGWDAMGVQADALRKESLQEAERVIRKERGVCSILINGAGGNHPKGTTDKEVLAWEDLEEEGLKTFFDLDEQGIRFVFDLNFLGTLLPSQVFCRAMKDGKDNCVINISSMNAFTPLTKIPAYSGAKAAVSNFTQWLAVHLSKVGIRVNAIAPGFFETNQNRALLRNEDGSYSARAEKILSQTPMGRFGDPRELLGTLFWLVDSRTSGFVNGVVIPVDGGFSAYSGV